MKKQLTERQLWHTWQNEYNRWTRAGFDITEAVRRADAAVAAKRTPMPEAVAEPNPRYPDTRKMVIVKGKGTPKEKRIETDVTVYLLKNNNEPVLDLNGRPIYVTIPED